MKDKILQTIEDLVSDFLYYDRKEDSELSLDDIIQAFDLGEITLDDMVNTFRQQLEKNL